VVLGDDPHEACDLTLLSWCAAACDGDPASNGFGRHGDRTPARPAAAPLGGHAPPLLSKLLLPLSNGVSGVFKGPNAGDSAVQEDRELSNGLGLPGLGLGHSLRPSDNGVEEVAAVEAEAKAGAPLV